MAPNQVLSMQARHNPMAKSAPIIDGEFNWIVCAGMIGAEE